MAEPACERIANRTMRGGRAKASCIGETREVIGDSLRDFFDRAIDGTERCIELERATGEPLRCFTIDQRCIPCVHGFGEVQRRWPVRLRQLEMRSDRARKRLD